MWIDRILREWFIVSFTYIVIVDAHVNSTCQFQSEKILHISRKGPIGLRARHTVPGKEYRNCKKSCDIWSHLWTLWCISWFPESLMCCELRAELQDAWSEGSHQADACRPLWWGILYQEGDIARSCGTEGWCQATGKTYPDAIQQQGECATSWGYEGCT
jgi:hypothetical protein